MAAQQWLAGDEGDLVNDIPYMVRRNQHKIGKAGRRSEKRLARELGADPRLASGALDRKGDMALGECLIEAKSTTQASLGLKFSWLAKISNEARSEGRTPCLTVSFVDEQGNPHLDGEWALIPMHRFKELTPWR
jgi:hypothetical protein